MQTLSLSLSDHLIMTLQEYIQSFIDPDYDSNNPLPFKVTSGFYKKGSTISKINEVENYAYFINNGIAEMSILFEEDEKIIDFYFKGDFFSSYESLLKNTPSRVQLKALTDLSVEKVYKQDLMLAYNTSLLANKIGRHATEKLYLKKFKRETDLLIRTAEQNYLELLNRDNKIISSIPVYKIARYLGIRPESLSRIRKKSIS